MTAFRKILLLLFFFGTLSAQESYTIPEFSYGDRTFPQMGNEIIAPAKGDELQEVKDVTALKPGEILLRRRYGASEYRLYKGMFSIKKESENLFIFEIPSNVTWKKVLTLKWYKERSVNPDADESDIYFDNNRIYIQFLSRLYYYDGSWKMIDAVNVSKGTKKVQPLGDLQITSNPDHAEIFIDNKSTGVSTPNYVPDLFEGQHSITLNLKNYQTFDTTVTVKSGEIAPVSIQLKSALGSLTLSSTPPGATVKINGVKNGITPLTVNDLVPGDFSVEMEYQNYKSADTILKVIMGRNTKWEATLDPDFGIVNLPEMPDSTIMLVDGIEHGKGDIKLNPGIHHVHIDGKGLYENRDSTFTVTLGQTLQLSITMKKLTGSIKVLPLPVDAEVYINDKSYGRGPVTINDLPTGTYTVTGMKTGYQTTNVKTVLRKNTTETVRLNLQQNSIFTEGNKKDKELQVPEGMVLIPEGTFMMGSENGESDEKPAHLVKISSFYMDKTEVTQKEYEQVMGNNPSSFKNCPDCPVEQVTWKEATAYCEKVGKRLPTEAEWEYAARAGSITNYHWGNTIDGEYAYYKGNSSRKSWPVAQKKPNAWGLYDMNGNAWEWCNDYYGYYFSRPYYSDDTLVNPPGPPLGESRVRRGGSAFNDSNYLRTTNRDRCTSDDNCSNGFRCVRSK
jgi:formylglycine-generating enzyme required for sulfatase activity